MIPANELRYGLWVLVDGEPTKIENLEITNGEVVDPMYPEPMPLTPKIIEKAGFESVQADYKKGNFELFAGHNEWWFGWKIGLSVRLDYVHQLQNLYFPLTNEELKIEL